MVFGWPLGWSADMVSISNPKCLCGFTLTAGRISNGPKQRPRMYLSCSVSINQSKRLQNFHLGVGKACEGEWWMVTWLLSKPPAARQPRKPIFKGQPWDLRSKQKEPGENVQTHLSLHCLPTSSKNPSHDSPSDMVAIHYVLSLRPGPSFGPQSSGFWLVCVSFTNGKIYHSEYDSPTLSWRCRIVTDSELWGLAGWLSFCCSSPNGKKTEKKKTHKTNKQKTWRHSFGFFYRRVVIITS